MYVSKKKNKIKMLWTDYDKWRELEKWQLIWQIIRKKWQLNDLFLASSDFGIITHVIKQLSSVLGLVDIDLRGQIGVISNVSIVMHAVCLAACVLLLLDSAGDGRYRSTVCQ